MLVKLQVERTWMKYALSKKTANAKLINKACRCGSWREGSGKKGGGNE